MPGILLFFFNDTATTEIYTLSLHDALPIWPISGRGPCRSDRRITTGLTSLHKAWVHAWVGRWLVFDKEDRKSTRLNSSHANISYAVFCLKKKKGVVCGVVSARDEQYEDTYE